MHMCECKHTHVRMCVLTRAQSHTHTHTHTYTLTHTGVGAPVLAIPGLHRHHPALPLTLPVPSLTRLTQELQALGVVLHRAYLSLQLCQVSHTSDFLNFFWMWTVKR